MNVNRLLADRQHIRFVGREQELAAMQTVISDSQWLLMHIYGPGGIGKSTLLSRFIQTIASEQVIYFNGYSGYRKPEDFLSKLQRLLPDHEHTSDPVHALNHYASVQGRIVLVFDTFEQWNWIEDWLRLEFLPQLNQQVSVIMAGRYPLSYSWQREGWMQTVRQLELAPLSSAEVRQYAANRGVHDSAIIDALYRFCLGYPLAMTMACELIIRQGKTSFLQTTQQEEMIASLATELTADIKNPAFLHYLEAASAVWKFDQEMLQALLQEEISIIQFRQFCELPFVIRIEQQWSLHDSIRQWMFTDFRNRKPQTYARYRSRALQEIRQREGYYPSRKTDLAFEKLYLHEDDFVRDLCYQWSGHMHYQACEDAHLDQIIQIYTMHLASLPAYNEADPNLTPLIEPLWKLGPSSFYGLWREDQLVAFSSSILLTEQSVALLRSNPITAPATASYSPDDRQYITCLAGSHPDLVQEISGSLARALTRLIDREATIIMLLPLPEWEPFLLLLGYERIPWADAITPYGIEYVGYRLDLRVKELPANVDRMLTMLEEHQTSDSQLVGKQADSRLTIEETVPHVQRVLKHYNRLHQWPELADSLRFLLKEDKAQDSALTVAQRLQTEIAEKIQEFTAGTSEEQRYALILTYAYVKKLGTHERVAEHLNLSAPTYYRYLRLAVRELTYRWVVL